jgi:hypothetical protein
VPGSRDGPGRADVPDQPDAGHARSTDRPDPSSRAGLQLRLERLLPGHPSSPRNAADSGPARNAADSGPARNAAADKRQAPARAAKRDHGRAGARDGRGEAPAGPADAGGDASRDGGPSRDGGAGPDGPGPPGPPGRGPDAPRRNYWTEVPRFLQAWADHVSGWSAERRAAGVDRSRDPAGSWRGDGNQYLSPGQHAKAKDVIAGVQRAERALTGDMREVARDNACGGWLDGLQFRCKGEERLKEKIAGELGITPAMKPEDAIGKIKDAIRYTFCFEPGRYSDGYWDVKHRLEAREYRMVYSKNHWRDDPEYKGINSRWVTPEGQQFELQFHTPESFDAKQQVTHGSYERLRNPLTDDDERKELEAFQREACSWIAVPAGVHDIPDYRRKGH